MCLLIPLGNIFISDQIDSSVKINLSKFFSQLTKNSETCNFITQDIFLYETIAENLKSDDSNLVTASLRLMGNMIAESCSDEVIL